MAILCAAALWRIALIVPLHVPLDPNEGWNAYHAADAMSGLALYPAPSSFMINNYPPLFFYLEGLFGRVTGDNIVAGRILSLASLAAMIVLIVAIARRMGCALVEGGFAAALLTAHLLLSSDYVGMNDPQLLGHAIDLGALLVLLIEPRTTRIIVVSAALFVLAGFVKHNLVVMPLAATVWLLLRSRREGVTFAAFGIGFALLGLVLFQIAFGTSLASQLASARSYSVGAALAAERDWLWFGLLPGIGLAYLAARHRDPPVLLAALLALIGFISGAISSGGAGVDVNAFFDADIGLCLGVALLLKHLRREGVRHPGLAALAAALPLAVTLWLPASPDWRDPDYWLHPEADDAETAQGDIAYLQSHPGPALCETLALCYWAGKQAEVDVFNLGEAYKTHARNDAALAHLVDARQFSVVEFETLSPFALTPRIRAALDRGYRLDRSSDDGVFFVPKPRRP